MNLSNHSIKLLPEFLIDQIKAGEIIERPAHLVKEVIENSLDAQATKIEIHMIQNGLEQITIQDNGKGIPFQDLPYAFCRHATSKIAKFQDLYNLGSFGFRGEALASIAAVAQVTCVSRCSNGPEDADSSGGQISLSGGQIQDHIKQKDLPYGTLLMIKDLFFNTPVRLNFIKSQTAEKNSLLRILNAFLISHPQIEFHLKWDQAEKNIFRSTDRLQRFTQVLSANRWKQDDFCFIEKKYEDYQITGFYSKFSKKSGQAKNQYLFVNKRLIQDQVLRQIILSTLENCWPPGTSGAYLFDLDIPKNQVDVNVHPNKTFVKFAQPSIIHSLAHTSLKESISSQTSPPDKYSHEFKNYDEAHDPKRPAFQSYEHQKQISLPFISIGPRYALFHQEKEADDCQDRQGDEQLQKNNFPFVVDYVMFIRFHLDAITPQFTEDKRVPLLVGIPFRGQEIVSKILQYKSWEKYHFEFDQLQDDLVILSAAPHSLTLLPYKAAIFHLLGESKRFEQAIENESLSTIMIYDLIKKYPLGQLIYSQSILILSPEYLTKLFQ